MRGNVRRIKAAEPAPIDSIDVIDRKEFESRLADVYDAACIMNRNTKDYAEQEIRKLKEEKKKVIAVGGIIAAAICFIMLCERRTK